MASSWKLRDTGFDLEANSDVSAHDNVDESEPLMKKESGKRKGADNFRTDNNYAHDTDEADSSKDYEANSGSSRGTSFRVTLSADGIIQVMKSCFAI
ncbi:hypothetical protein E2542_SST06216 [Spatholobus suberectus]|nr:hypothetical protein E2542_SST06216 [Spatholobus suberectus]